MSEQLCGDLRNPRASVRIHRTDSARLGVAKGYIVSIWRFRFGVETIRCILTTDIHATVSAKNVERSVGIQEQ